MMQLVVFSPPPCSLNLLCFKLRKIPKQTSQTNILTTHTHKSASITQSKHTHRNNGITTTRPFSLSSHDQRNRATDPPPAGLGRVPGFHLLYPLFIGCLIGVWRPYLEVWMRRRQRRRHVARPVEREVRWPRWVRVADGFVSRRWRRWRGE